MDFSTEQIADFCHRNDISFLGVYGSVARGEETPESDIDILIRFAGPKTLLDLVRVERELSELLGRKVDIATEGALSPYLKDQILNSVKPLYEAA